MPPSRHGGTLTPQYWRYLQQRPDPASAWMPAELGAIDGADELDLATRSADATLGAVRSSGSCATTTSCSSVRSVNGCDAGCQRHAKIGRHVRAPADRCNSWSFFRRTPQAAVSIGRLHSARLRALTGPRPARSILDKPGGEVRHAERRSRRHWCHAQKRLACSAQPGGSRPVSSSF
jgi:hypothetical protein